MKGPGLKNARPGGKISKRPSSTASKAKKGFSNVAKQFKSEVSVNAKDLKRSTTSKISKRPASIASKAKRGFGNVANQFAKAAKKSLPKIGRVAGKVARLGLRGSVAGGAIMAAGESMYKRGKKTGFKPPQFKKAKVNKKFNINKKK